MMALVKLALRRPLSVAVMALLMLVMGVLSFTLMNVDIFPAINLPVVMVVWSYPGLNAIDTERRLVIISERAYSTTVDGIDHIESESMLGIGIGDSLAATGPFRLVCFLVGIPTALLRVILHNVR
jgi:multidrug efflux pump subunit AcrB